MESKLKFCAVVNANALRNQKLLNQVIDLLKTNHKIEIFETKSKEEARDIFKKLSLKLFDRLIITGGDGSFNFAINEIIKYPSLSTKELGYIPSGTANILGIEAKIKNNARSVYDLLVSNNVKKIQLSKANDQYFFLMAGIGFDGQIVEAVNNSVKRYFGKLAFIYKSLTHFIFFKPNQMMVTSNNETIDANWVLSTNAKYYGGKYSITSKTGLFEKGLITYAFVNLTRLKLIYFFFLSIFKGDLSSAKEIKVFQSNKISIKKINHPLPVQIDGDYSGRVEQIQIEQTDKFVSLLSY